MQSIIRAALSDLQEVGPGAAPFVVGGAFTGAGALLAALYVRRTLSRDCELYLNAEIDTRAWEKKKHGSHVSSMVQDAREALSQRLRSANPVGELGGCEQVAVLLSPSPGSCSW